MDKNVKILSREQIDKFERVARAFYEAGEAQLEGGAFDVFQAMCRQARAAQPLWELLDDIDTADDEAKGDNARFRLMARRAANLRQQWLVSIDGQTLEFPTPERKVNQRHRIYKPNVEGEQ